MYPAEGGDDHAESPMTPETIQGDRLFAALRIAIPEATHAQLLAIIQALEAYIGYRVMGHLSL